MFRHTDDDLSPYTDYDASGNYVREGARPLPDRYYTGVISGSVHYKGGTVTYVELLEEAVVSGDVELDESKDVWHNIRTAEYVLIESRARPLYQWSSTLYSEDGQYRYRVENGKVTGAVQAFYEESDGRRITAKYIAEQLAAGVLPAELDGDWSFLAHLDSELYDKAVLLGRAARNFGTIDKQYQDKSIPEEEYLQGIHMYLLYLLGRDEGHRSAAQLRIMLKDPGFGGKALSGAISRKPPQPPAYRRQIKPPEPEPAVDQTWLQPRTRRRIGQDPS